MKIVIDIDEELYKQIKKDSQVYVLDDVNNIEIENAIYNGTPLPEHLNKIRAEIVDLGQRTMNDNRASGIWACRDIIDKYIEGSDSEC